MKNLFKHRCVSDKIFLHCDVRKKLRRVNGSDNFSQSGSKIVELLRSGKMKMCKVMCPFKALTVPGAFYWLTRRFISPRTKIRDNHWIRPVTWWPYMRLCTVSKLHVRQPAPKILTWKKLRAFMYRDASHLWRSFLHNRTNINIQVLNNVTSRMTRHHISRQHISC